MKYQERFLTIWDTPTKQPAKPAKARISLTKSLALFAAFKR
ncbi:hypothetical protein [Vreelandella sp. EE22]